MTDKRGAVRLVTEVMSKGLDLLTHAYEYAVDASTDPSEFAVEISRLRETGLTDSEFRWLIAKSYVLHFEETTLAGDHVRSLRPRSRARFTERSCFMLSDAGREFVDTLFAGGMDIKVDVTAELAIVTPELAVPRWDAERQTLSFFGQIVKQFKLPSPNQVAVLAAFEEEGWPPKIFDPLLREPEIEPKRRLQDTIKGLNRAQRNEIIRFLGDGSGEGVVWEPIERTVQEFQFHQDGAGSLQAERRVRRNESILG